MPTINARRFAYKLIDLREQAGKTQREVHENLGIAISTLIRYENASSQPRIRDLRLLCDYYGAAEEDQAVLELLWGKAKESAWWAAGPREKKISPAYELLFSLEKEATSITRVSIHLIPGTLQTERYALAVEKALFGQMDGEAAQNAALRLARWEAIMARPTPPQLRFVIEEGILRRSIGGDHAMVEQMDKLLSLPDWVDIRISPAGSAATTTAGFSLFYMDRDIYAAADSPLGMIFCDRADQVDQLNGFAQRMLQQAFSAHDSREIIAKVADEFRSGGPHLP